MTIIEALQTEAAQEPILGRAADLEVVCSGVRRIRNGGGAFFVLGEAGIGKSALLDAVATTFAPDTAIQHCPGFLRQPAAPYSALGDMLHPFLGLDVDSGAPTDGEPPGQAFDVQLDHAFGLVHLSLGDYAAALGPLVRAARATGTTWAPVVVPDLVEAGIRTGRRDLVVHVASSVIGWPLVESSPRARGLVARVEALLAGDDWADRLYRRSMDELTAAGDEVALARTQLVYGEWLRRHHHRRHASDVLRSACATFEATPSKAFAARAHAEYLAAGGGNGEASDATFGLTAREHQVAQQAARGQTNREIAATLYVSPWTVDFHLRKVFRKLGIRSRRQLPSAFAGASGGAPLLGLAQPA